MTKKILFFMLALIAIPLLYKGLKSAYSKYNRIKAEGYLDQTLPEIIGTDIRGNRYNLKSYKGKNVIIVFWASWCGSCLREIPNLKTFYASLEKDSDIVFLSSTMDDNVELSLKTIEKLKINYPVMIDKEAPGKNSSFNKHFQITHLPSIWVIDKTGTVKGENLVHIEEALKIIKP